MDFEVEFLYSKFLQSNGVSIDTRTLQEDNLFFALSGPNFNGNEYAARALAAGASFAIVDDPDFDTEDRTVLVDDSLKALQELATFHRSRYKRPLIGLTGSNGKTTTKELINAVLSQKYITHATTGNLNNHIGVPLTLLHIHPQVEVAIIEMGANAVGEIAQLCSYCRPTHGLITNIGKAHIEGFGGVEGIIRGKSELFDFLKKNDGEVFINTQDPALANMAKRFKHPHLLPGKGSYAPCELVSADPYIVYRTENGEEVETQLIGAYNIHNIAYALAIAKYFDVLPELANQAIRDYVPSNNRSQLLERNGKTIIMDAYNANPTSMAAAIVSMREYSGKKTVILGDMLELGDQSKNEHAQIGSLLKAQQVDECLLVGPLMKEAKSEVPHGRHFKDKNELSSYLENNSLVGQTVLVKASRGMSLESIVDLIK
ncbi:MAG: UDP-N-acetylmuramoyl-tripeptide--D-alanyl-D-alanine ligase [Cyclobacteriaceae bacterium]